MKLAYTISLKNNHITKIPFSDFFLNLLWILLLGGINSEIKMFLGDINSEIERAGISTEAIRHGNFAVSCHFKTKKKIKV